MNEETVAVNGKGKDGIIVGTGGGGLGDEVKRLMKSKRDSKTEPSPVCSESAETRINCSDDKDSVIQNGSCPLGVEVDCPCSGLENAKGHKTASCSISERNQTDQANSDINQDSVIDSHDRSANSGGSETTVLDELNSNRRNCDDPENKPQMKDFKHSVEESLLKEGQCTASGESVRHCSQSRCASRRCSQSSLSSDAGSTTSTSRERRSKRLSVKEANTASDSNERAKSKHAKELQSLEDHGQRRGSKDGANSGNGSNKSKKKSRGKVIDDAYSTGTDESDFEDNLSLATLCSRERDIASLRTGACPVDNKSSTSVMAPLHVSRKSHNDLEENVPGVTQDDCSGGKLDVLSKVSASKPVVQSSPQKRMEQLLGQTEKSKDPTSLPKARKTIPSVNEKRPPKKMPRAKMSLSPNRLSSITIDNFFKPVDGKVRERPKAKKSLSHSSAYKMAKEALSLSPSRSAAMDTAEEKGALLLEQVDTMISSAAAAQALSALKTDGSPEDHHRSIQTLDGCMSDAENSQTLSQAPSPVKVQRMPKAKKSFPHGNRKHMSTDAESSQVYSESLANCKMSFKIQDLASVFGLNKNLDKLDAKTLDKIVLECAMKSKDKAATRKSEPSPPRLSVESETGRHSKLSSCSFYGGSQSQLSSVSSKNEDGSVNFASILTTQKILKQRKKRRRSRMGTYNLPTCHKKHKSKPKKSKGVSKANNAAPVLEKNSTSSDLCVTPEEQISVESIQYETEASRSLGTESDPSASAQKVRKRPYRKRMRFEPRKKIPKYIRARLRDLQKRIHSQRATPEQEELYYQLESASKLDKQRLPSSFPGKRKRQSKDLVDDDTRSVVSTSTSFTESEMSFHSKDGGSGKCRRVDDSIPSLSPVTDIPIVNHAHHLNSHPPKISPQKITGISMLKQLSNQGRLKLSRLSPGLECLDAVPGSQRHHIEGASGADAQRVNDQFEHLPPYKFHNTPNGITYPVTPPHTPEHGVSPADGDVLESREIQGSDRRSDFIPVCCCKLPGTVISSTLPGYKTSLYCQALDSVNGKVVGCCTKVTSAQMVRPAHKIPFMVLCEAHRERLKMHQCCPGCGQFCTEGKFLQCKSEINKKGIVILHHFHSQCQTYKANKYFCPHCAHESDQYEVIVKFTGSRSSWATVDMVPPGDKHVTCEGSKSARMGMLSPSTRQLDSDMSPGMEMTVPHTNKIVSSKKFPLGPTRAELESAMSVLDSDRAKKLRQGSKNLFKACRVGDVEKVIVMLADGADPNQRYEDDHGQCPLHAAAAMGHHLIVHLLLQAGANPHAIDNGLSTPLIIAAEKGNMSIIQILVRSGGLVDARRSDGMTCLHLAAQTGKVEPVRFLLETGRISVNVKDDGGWTPLIWAAEHSHLNVVHYLLASGADPNIRDNEGNTALHWAAFSGSTDIAEIFLNAGCDLEAVNEIGDRPLHIAARQDHYECVVLFLARGADSEARNNDNEAPISCCTEQNTPTWMALRVNRQLQGFATRKLQLHDRLLHRDISYGRDTTPMPVVNMVDNENYPTDFLYVTDYVETTPMNVNRLITSLSACRCKESCGSVFCECSHNSVKCWYEKDGKLVKDFNYSDPPLIFECNKACRCWSSCQNRVVQLGISCRLQVFRTEGRGWGVHTLLDIPQGTFVCEYIGELISDAEADSREDDSYLFDLDNKDTDTYCIDARRYGNISRFINHLCQPNLIPVKVFVDHQDLRFPRICFFASRDIKAYEELGFDYGEKFWIIKWKQFTCTCGSPKCRYSKDTIQKTLDDYNRRQGDDEPVVEQP